MDAKSVKKTRAPATAQPRLVALPGSAPRAPSAGLPPYLADPSRPEAIALRRLLDDWLGTAAAEYPRESKAPAVSGNGDTGSTTPARVNARAGVVLRLRAQRREGKG